MSQRARAVGLVAIDALAWFAGIALAVAARLDFDLERIRWVDLAFGYGHLVYGVGVDEFPVPPL